MKKYMRVDKLVFKWHNLSYDAALAAATDEVKSDNAGLEVEFCFIDWVRQCYVFRVQLPESFDYRSNTLPCFIQSPKVVN